MKKSLLSLVLVFLLLIGSISAVFADEGLTENNPVESEIMPEQPYDGNGLVNTDAESIPEMPDADGHDAGDLEDDIISDEEIIEEEIISEAVDAAGAEIVAEAVAEELSLEAKNAIDSPFDINFIHNGVTYSAFMKADKKYYLFVPNNVTLSDITLNCFGFAPQTVSSGEINKETNQIISPFAVSGDTLSVTTDKGDSYVITVMQSNVPSVEIELFGTDLNTINSGSKDTKYKGNRVTIVDDYGSESVNENVTVKGRGNTTWVDSDKKPYQLSFDKKASVLGMEPAKKWILLACAFDDSLMRNQIAFETAAKLGMYGTTEYRFANLWVDGEYRGLYLIGEKIELGKNRLNLMHPQGCVFEMDTAFYGGEQYYFQAGGQMYTVKESVTEEESDILAAEQNFKDKVNGLLNYIGSSQNISVEELSKYIDVQSFAQLYLMTDYFENGESFITSCFYYQDGPDDVIHAGPVWDNDSCMGNNVNSLDTSAYSTGGTTLSQVLMSCRGFRDYVKSYFNNTRGVFSEAAGIPDAYYNYISSAADMNYIRWDVLGKQPGKSANIPFKNSFYEAKESLKNWLSRRAGFYNADYPIIIDRRNNSIDLQYIPQSGLSSVTFYIWKSGESQPRMKNVNAVKQGDGTWKASVSLSDLQGEGSYNVHIYSGGSYLGSALKYIYNIKYYTKAYSYDLNGKETTMRSVLTGDVPDSGVRAAVWSDVNGQDDIRWYNCMKSAYGEWFVDIPVKNHASPGHYSVHFYTGSSFLSSTGFNITKSAATVKVEKESNEEASVTVKDVVCPSGVKQIKAAVWKKADQSDLKWFVLSKKSNGEYSYKFSLKDFKLSSGKYNVHVYIVGNNGTTVCAGTGTAELKYTAPEVKVTTGSVYTKVDLSQLRYAEMFRKIHFAVWSEAKGGQDMKWYTGTFNSANKTASVSFKQTDYKSLGKFYVHIYGETSSGEKIFITGTEYTLETPKAGNITVQSDNAKGTIKVNIKEIQNKNLMKNISVAIWSKADQSDMVWYEAKADGDGYTVSTDISKHKYNLGKYTIHVYIKDIYNNKKYTGGGSAEFKITCDSVEMGEPENERYYPVIIKNLIVPGGAKNVRFAVWSEAGGQDDLKWYTGIKSGNDYSVDVDIQNHRTKGVYLVHIYAQTNSGELVFVKNTASFEVNSSAKTEITVTDVRETNGKIDVSVAVTEKTSEIAGIRLAVWSRADQSDLHWYTAIKRDDDRYTCTIDVNEHQANFADYYVHAYAFLENGIQLFSGAANTGAISAPENYMSVLGSNSQQRKTIVIQNTSENIKSVKIAVWSSIFGQDDLKWYTAEKKNGKWIADVVYSNHKNPGVFYAHAYADDKYLKGCSFNFYFTDVNSAWASDYVAHANGGIGSSTYTNSKEALELSYLNGRRSVEVDFSYTSDGIIVLNHLWNLKNTELPAGYIPTFAEYMSQKINGQYSPMSLEDLLYYMIEHEDLWVITDSKTFEEDDLLRCFNDVYKLAYSMRATEVLDRFVIQIYDKYDVSRLRWIYPFENIILTTYTSWDGNVSSFESFCSYCRANKISSIVMPYERYNAQVQNIANRYGIVIYLHTINDKNRANSYFATGVRGIYTDFIL